LEARPRRGIRVRELLLVLVDLTTRRRGGDAIILGEEHIQKSRQKGHYTLEEHCVGGS
jgi:hypothetical protein